MNVIQVSEPGSRQLVVAELSTAVGEANGIETSTLFLLFTDSGLIALHYPGFLLAAYYTSVDS